MTDATAARRERKESLRLALKQATAERNAWRAVQIAREVLALDAGPRDYRAIRATADGWAVDDTTLPTLRVAVLSSFTADYAQDALVALAFASGLRVTTYQSGFAQFRQEMLDSTSGLYAFEPDAVFLAVEGDDWCPVAYSGFAEATEASRAEAPSRIAGELRSLLTAFRSRSARPVVVHNLAQPRGTAMGIMDATLPLSQRSLVARCNDAIREVAAEFPSTYVLDYAGLVNATGAMHWYDRRMALFAGSPIAASSLGSLAQEWCKYLRAFAGSTRKCLVLDLDNTLWGGVIGEDGLAGIKLGTTYPGNAFTDFQRAIIGLWRRGVILAVASKNNPADAYEVFDRHEAMQLRREHFSAWEINWNHKSESLRTIARSLNIGLEHMVFADDNPAECDAVRTALPMVTVINLPREPERYVEALAADGWFDAVALSAEDLRRSELYRQRDMAEAARGSFDTLDDYLADLDMEIVIKPVDRASLARAAQLTQKTNQFNATTRRYSEADISARMDGDWLLATVAVRDRFGDHGIVGLMMAQVQDAQLHIDTFLLSCRVIGRAVESAMLAWLCDRAVERDAGAIVGTIVPTAKNVPIRNVFQSHGFDLLQGDPSAETTTWRLEPGSRSVQWPRWFRVAASSPQDAAATATHEQ